MADVTNNLSLHIIDESEYIEPDPINENFKKVDAAFADYVVEQGTKGEWWYRKWNSGRLECGVDAHNFGTYTTSTNWGSAQGIYVGDALTFGVFPVAFMEIPFYTVSLVKSDYPGMAGWIGMGGGTNPNISSVSKTNSGYFYYANPNKTTFNNMYCSCYATGRWK